MPETAQLTVRLDLEGNLTSGITKAQRQLNGLSTSVGRVGKGFGQIGAGLTRAGLFVGGAAVAGIGAAAKAAIDFEDAFAGVKKTVNETDLRKAGLSFESLQRSFRDMATTIPIAATDFAKLGETAGALGVRAQDIETFVKTTALLGVTTNLTADAAADALGRIGTILRFTGKDYVEFSDSLVALGNAGASTESEIIEISKRFAAEARAAGLAKEEIAGLASVVATFAQPERAGTGLARVFASLGTNISLANKKGQAFSKLVGRPIKDLQSDLNKGKGLPLFLDLLAKVKGLSPVQANRTLKALGVTNQTDRSIIRNFSELLPEVNRQLTIAKTATGALSTEATKRFDTVASKLKLLQQNLIEAGITIGEGFAPAIGRAAVKLSEFLKLDANKSALKSLGEDIGKAIDGIDWNEVLSGARDFVGVMKTALGFTLRILDAIKGLPTEVKAAGAAFLVLNKLSGGLLASGAGNVIGGLAGAATQGLLGRTPGLGKLFAQPVFVTNWPIGGIGGGGAMPVTPGSGWGALFALIGPAVIAAIASKEIADSTNRDFANAGVKTNFMAPGSGNLPFGIQASLHNLGEAIKLLQNGRPTGRAPSDPNPVNFLPKLTDSFNRAVVPVTAAVAAAGVKTATAAQMAGLATTLGIAASGAVAAGAAHMAGDRVAGAIASKDMSVDVMTKVTVNVTASNVSKEIVIQKRYGPGNGSRGSSLGGGFMGGAR